MTWYIYTYTILSWYIYIYLYIILYLGTYIYNIDKRYKLASPRKAFYLATFYSIYQTSFAPKNGWGMLVYALGWSLPSQFWSYTPLKKLVFPRPKKWKFPTENGVRARPLLKKNLRPQFIFSSFSAVFVENSVTPMSTLANNKQSCSKWWKKSGQNTK